MVDDVLAVLRFAEPAARRIGDEQLLAEQTLAHRRQIRAEAAVLRDGRAERIAHELRRLAAGLHETGRPAIARIVELQRIGLAAVDAAHDEIDALQAFERLQEDAVASGAQVAALDQQVAEIARQVGVTEVVVVVRAWRQQRDARIAAPGKHRQVGLHTLEEGREAHAVAGLEQVAGDVRVHDTIGERIADAGRRLGVIVDDAPAAIGLACEVDGVELQVSRCRLDAVAWAQKGGIGENERRRDQAIAQ